MTQATDLIDLLLARRRAAAQPGSPRFSVAQLLARLPPPAARPTPVPMSRWRALRSLWWQHWEPRPRDQRGLHWLGLIGSALIHGGLLVLLLWLAIVSWAIQQFEPEADRIQVSFVGRATPDQADGGGGAVAVVGAVSANAAAANTAQTRQARPPARGAQAPNAQARPRSATAPSHVPVPPATEAAAMPPLPQAAVSTSPPQPPPAPLPPDPKPLLATQAEVASTDFIVPPPSWLQLPDQPAPEVAAPTVRERTVEPVTARPRVTVPTPVEPVAPALPGREVQVREREVAVVEAPQLRELPPPALPASTPLVAPAPGVREREIADLPEPAPGPAPLAPAAAATSSTPPSSAAAAPAATQAPRAGAERLAEVPRPVAGTGVGTGPKPVDRKGGWDAPQRGDDWGVGQHPQAGSPQPGQGLYNRDGSARLGEAGRATTGPAERGAPGGETDNWSREQIAQSGTWLKRPPYDYTPTSFDKYWVPNQSLLEEWVRNGIKKIEIAIPGTSTRISCVVSMLQFGGGCGLTDPNMNEQPAGSRPPPDIPFKKELQEDNGSTR